MDDDPERDVSGSAREKRLEEVVEIETFGDGQEGIDK